MKRADRLYVSGRMRLTIHLSLNSCDYLDKDTNSEQGRKGRVYLVPPEVLRNSQGVVLVSRVHGSAAVWNDSKSSDTFLSMDFRTGVSRPNWAPNYMGDF